MTDDTKQIILRNSNKKVDPFPLNSIKKTETCDEPIKSYYMTNLQIMNPKVHQVVVWDTNN